MPALERRSSRKSLPPDKKFIYFAKEVLSPSKIAYYGRPITELGRDELISALTELSRMYMECKGKDIK